MKPLRIAASVLGGLLCLVLLPVLIFNVALAVQGYRNADQLPMAFGYAPLLVNSGSMMPEISTEDLIFIKKTDPASLHNGDVITYISSTGSAVTHRIIGIDQAEDGTRVFITKGDANNTADALPVDAGQVAGVYVGRLNNAGEIARFLQTMPGMLLCAGLPVALYLAWTGLRAALLKRRKPQDTPAA